MWRAELLHRLADYASTLADLLGACTNREEREAYLHALAFVGVLLGKINDDEPRSVLQPLVDAEDAAFRWNFLTSEDTKIAEEAWNVFHAAFQSTYGPQRLRRSADR